MQGAVYALLGTYGFMAPTVAFQKARDADELALKLDPKYATAHSSLGYLHRADWDWRAADREYQLALALAPRDPTVLFLAASQSLTMGRWDGAMKLINGSLALDPLNPASYAVLAFVQVHRGQLQEAEAAARRTLAISPTFTSAHSYLGDVLLARGDNEAALAEMLKEGDEPSRLRGFAMAYFAMGRKTDSDSALAQLLERQSNHPFRIAQVYAFRGEPDEAFKWLDRAYTQKDRGLVNIKFDSSFKKLEGDPRYKAFLRKMNLPE
jgi:tetratricopeptide (TPR) repeat protein